MFKSTNHFFRKVYEDKVTRIDQQNYVYSITNNHDLSKLKTLSFDLDIFISNIQEHLESELETDQIEKQIERYKEHALEIPYKQVLNIDYLLAKTKNLPLDNIPEKLDIVDMEQMFYSNKLFPIRSLKFLIDSLIKKLLEQRKQELEKESCLIQETDPGRHPKYDPNLWNKDCFELFKYLYDCYYKSTKRQLTNIWFYLKESGNKKYILKATKEQYEDFIFENYQIKITNFEKAQTKWEEKEYNTIDNHRINFEDTLKQIAENAKNT